MATVKTDAGGMRSMESSRAERSGGKKHVRAIHTERGEKGGHVVTHHYAHGPDMPYHESKAHVFGKNEGVEHVKHYIKHAGVRGVKAVATDDGNDTGAGAGTDAGGMPETVKAAKDKNAPFFPPEDEETE